MSSAPAKFTFDLDLGGRNERNAVVTDSAMALMLSKARAEGFEQGVAEGEKSVASKSAKALVAAAEALANRTAAIAAERDDHRRIMLSEATALAATIGKKLAAHLLAEAPAAELAALITECLASLEGAPHLVVHCNPVLADSVREIALARIATSGFDGRLIVLGDPDTALGDGKIEWVDGGLVRDRAAVEAEIDDLIAAFVAAKGAKTTKTVTPNSTAPGEDKQ